MADLVEELRCVIVDLTAQVGSARAERDAARAAVTRISPLLFVLDQWRAYVRDELVDSNMSGQDLALVNAIEEYLAGGEPVAECHDPSHQTCEPARAPRDPTPAFIEDWARRMASWCCDGHGDAAPEPCPDDEWECLEPEDYEHWRGFVRHLANALAKEQTS